MPVALLSSTSPRATSARRTSSPRCLRCAATIPAWCISSRRLQVICEPRRVRADLHQGAHQFWPLIPKVASRVGHGVELASTLLPRRRLVPTSLKPVASAHHTPNPTSSVRKGVTAGGVPYPFSENDGARPPSRDLDCEFPISGCSRSLPKQSPVAGVTVWILASWDERGLEIFGGGQLLALTSWVWTCP